MAAAGIQLPDEPGLPGATDPYPATITLSLEKVETLRYGENPHQPAARYQRPAPATSDGPFASNAPPLQGKTLSFNNVLDASAADALGRALRGPGVAIVKHTNPCGAAERPTLLEAWHAALEADPVSAFGGVVALTRPVDRPVAEALVSIFLEIVIAPGFDEAAREVLATKPNLRVLVDPALANDGPARRPPRPSRTRSARSGPPGARCSSPRRTRWPMTPRSGSWPRNVRRRTGSISISTSPGGSSAASPRTRSSSSASGG